MKNFVKRPGFFLAICLLLVMLPVLTAEVAATNDIPDIDPANVFDSVVELTVYVDGEISNALSGTYPWGEIVTLNAPAVEGKTFRYWTDAQGTPVSYSSSLTVKMYTNTLLDAVYKDGEEAETAVPISAFLSVTRDSDQIMFNAIATVPEGSSMTAAGVRYSLTKDTQDALKGDEDVTVEPATGSGAYSNWILAVTPTITEQVVAEDETYYAIAFVETADGTYYSDVVAVKLSELDYGMSAISYLDIEKPTLSGKLCAVTFAANGGEGAMAPQGMVIGRETALNANTFTREGYTFSGWSTTPTGSVTYTDGQTVTLTADTTLYAQWKVNSSGHSSGGGGGAAPATNPVTVPTASASAASHGKVSSSAANAKAGEKVTVTPEPEEGYVTTGVTVTDKNGNVVPVTQNADGTYSFTMPATAVTVTPTFAVAGEQPPADDGSCPKDSTCPISKFSDASPTAWYHDGVHWALVEGIMNGTSDTTFAPNGTATRAMVVTMLWRMAGEPASSAPAPFSDVSSDAWYADAVAWAAETGAVNGTGADTFSPNTPVTREQLAAILYRYAQAEGRGFTGAWMFPLDFSDAADVSEWANEAMHWMTMNGIITGMGDGTLAPKDNATRAQIATMFMRFVEAMEK